MRMMRDDEPEEGFASAYAAAYDEYARENAPMPVLQRVRLHPVRCLVLVGLLAASAIRVRDVVCEAEPLWAVVAAVVAGVFLADLLTGLVHLAADCTPLRARTKKSFWQWARCALLRVKAHVLTCQLRLSCASRLSTRLEPQCEPPPACRHRRVVAWHTS